MSKDIILLVEDLPEEQEKAKSILRRNGFKFAIAATLEDAERIMKLLDGKISGIITDLHFLESDSVHSKNNPNTPCGLAVVAEAVELKIPVVVCSDINHHFAQYVKKVISELEKLNEHPIPFIMDSKNWGNAVGELSKILKEV